MVLLRRSGATPQQQRCQQLRHVWPLLHSQQCQQSLSLSGRDIRRALTGGSTGKFFSAHSSAAGMSCGTTVAALTPCVCRYPAAFAQDVPEGQPTRIEIFDEAYVVLRRPGKEPLALLDRCVSRKCLSAWQSQLHSGQGGPTRTGHYPEAP